MATRIENQVSAATGIAVERLQEIKRRRGLGDDVLPEVPLNVLRRLDRRLDLPDLPQARAQYLALRHRNADGSLPGPDTMWQAHEAALALRAAAPLSMRAGIATGLAPDASTPATWTALGPNNIGGRTRAIVPHPSIPGTLYAGSVGGGVWRTTDNGASWQPQDDKMTNLAICCMAMAPNGTLFAGTGEGFGNPDAIRGAGIFVSPDGSNWSPLPATQTEDFQWVNRLAINSDQVILAATLSGMMRSTDNGQTWSNQAVADFADVKFHPTNAALAIAGTKFGQAFVTNDAGLTWTASSPNPAWGSGRIELCYALADPNTVYASVNNNGGEIWRSTDGGATFTKRATQSGGEPAVYLGNQGWYDNVIWAGMPNDADFVLVGGVDLWRSTDGGDAVNRISLWWRDGSAHADHHAIVPSTGFDGVTNNTVYFGNDGGVYRADDVRTVGTPSTADGWTKLENGYAVTQFYYGAGNTQSGQIVAGAQDNGTLSTDAASGVNWFSLYGGDGGACAADQSDPGTFYGEYIYLQILRASNQANSGDFIDGQYWDGTRWQRKPPPYNLSDSGKRETALFIAPIAIDPNKGTRLLAGGASLWRTANAKAPLTPTTGPTWTAIKKPVGRALISAITISQANSNFAMLGYDNGEIWHATNAATKDPFWKSATPRLARGRMCTSLAFDPLSFRIRYATYGGYEGDTVLRINFDEGDSWTSITPSGLAVPVHSIAIHPNNSDWLYIGTDSGLWVSDDGGTTWHAGNAAPTTCAVFNLFWMGLTLVLVTHGRGVFSVDLSHTFDPGLQAQPGAGSLLVS